MKIGKHLIGPGCPTFIIAEIGINHNGDVKIAKKLIDVAVDAGCNAVKFQKRTVDVVYSEEELAKPRESPWGTTNGDQKCGLEFGFDEYREIFAYCKEKGILCSASCWDEGALEFIKSFNPQFLKIASACLTDQGLLEAHQDTELPLILSTGMSTEDEVVRAVDILEKAKNDYQLALMHTVSTYPANDEDLNLRSIQFLFDNYGIEVPIGYSGHEKGIATTVAAVVLGACIVERHITLDRTMYGSDQAASLEPGGLKRLVRDIRSVESALGEYKKIVLDAEIPIMQKLRRKYFS